MIVKCPVCGKTFDVLWPQLWRYRRDGKYLCGYQCMVQYDRKEGKEMTKISPEQKRKAIEIALEGGDPKPFLKECGSKNPENLWYWMKNKLKIEEPETYEMLAKGGRPKPIAGGDWEKMETPETPTVKLDGPLRIETPESNKIKVAVIGKPETAGELKREKRYTVTAIQYPEIGEFYYDRKYNSIDWRTPEGDEVSMNPTGWKLLLQDLNEIMTVLGVKM